MKRSLFVCLLAFCALSAQSFAQCAPASAIYSFDYAGHTYKIVKDKLTWSDAANCAVNLGGKLAEITSKAENDTIFSHLAKAGVQLGYATPSDGGGATYVWIGATDKHTEGMWIWDGDNNAVGDNFWNGQGAVGDGNGEGAPGMYNNWGGTSINGASPNEPDDFIAVQDGAAMALDFWPKGQIPPYTGIAGEWNDLNTGTALYYVVERSCLDKHIPRDTTICEGEKVFLGGAFQTTAGVYLDSFKTALGCDSVISTSLTILGGDPIETRDTICQGESVPFGGVDRTTAGRFEAIFQSSLGCDSIVALTLTVNPKLSSARTTTICRGESRIIGDTLRTEPGVYSVTYKSLVTGCDSVATTTLIVNSADTSVTTDGVTLSSNASGADYIWIDCDNGNTPVPNALSKNFTPAVAGHYAVVVIQNGCVDTSACYAASPSSVIENTFPTQIAVYPNPATDKVTIDLGDAYGNVTVKLVATNGKDVRSLTYANGETIVVNIGDLASGTYFLQINTPDRSALAKIIKK